MELKSIKEKMILVRVLKKEKKVYEDHILAEQAQEIPEEEKDTDIFENTIKVIDSMINRLEEDPEVQLFQEAFPEKDERD